MYAKGLPGWVSVLPELPTPTRGRGLRPRSPLAGPAEIWLPEGQPFPRPNRWLAVLLKAAEEKLAFGSSLLSDLGCSSGCNLVPHFSGSWSPCSSRAPHNCL